MVYFSWRVERVFRMREHSMNETKMEEKTRTFRVRSDLAFIRKLGKLFVCKHEEQRISLIGLLILMVLTMTAGISVYMVMQQQTKAILTKSIEVSLENYVYLFDTRIAQGMSDTRLIATRPFIINNLLRVNANPGNKKALFDLQQSVESFLPNGFTGISFVNARGDEVASAGQFSQNPSLRVPLNANQTAFLLWGRQFILQDHFDILDQQGHRIGMVITEANLQSLTDAFVNIVSIGKTGEFAICAPLRKNQKDMDCFVSGFSGRKFQRFPRVMGNEALPMNYALDGKTGIVFARDYRREKVVAAYSPVGTYDLGMVLKVDQTELYSPVTEHLKFIAFLLIALVVFGGLLLYWLVTPLVRKLTDSKRELSESGARLQAILDNAPLGIWLIGLDKRFRFMNKTFCNALGILESEVLAAKHPAEIFGSEVAANCMQSDRKCLEREIPHISHETLNFADGSAHLLEITKVKLRDYSGIVVGIIGISMDITERKQAEEALRESQKKLHVIVDTALDAVVQMDATGMITGWNIQAEKIFGWPRAEAVGQALHEIIIPFQYREAHIQGLKRFLASGEEHVLNTWFETLALRRDGREFPVELAVIPLKINEKYEFNAFIRDITDRKAAEESKLLAATVFDILDEAVMVTNADNKIIAINPAFTTITGFTLDEVLGKNPHMLSSNSQKLGFYQKMWKTLIATGSWDGEIVNRRKSGELYVEWASIKLVKDSTGKITHHVAAFSDISERKATEEHVRHLAHYDILTNLPNRSLFTDRLQQALGKAKRDKSHMALMFLDLDKFKQINDTLGHDVGDQLLKEVAKRIQECVRESDTAARLGGDEFIVLLPQIEAERDVMVVAEKILTALNAPFELAGHSMNISASIGVAVYPEHGSDEKMLIKNADIAMYRAKVSGGSSKVLFGKLE